MLSRFSEGITDLVIGRFHPIASVGMFSRGLGAIIFIKSLLEKAVGPVVLPHLSEVHRSGGSVASAYLKAINLLVVLSWPVMAVVSAAAYPIINLLFGDQWDLAVPLTSILVLWAIFTYAHYFGNAALIATNHEKLMFQISLVTFVFRFIVVVVAAVATKSLEHIAWAMVISGVFEAGIYVWALEKSIDVKYKDLWLTLYPNLVIAGCCWFVTKLIDYIFVFEAHSAFHSIAIIAPTLILVWLGLLVVMKHSALDLILGLFPGISARFRKSANTTEQ
jgi:O-antigen/teichoic acid export membrane protein